MVHLVPKKLRDKHKRKIIQVVSSGGGELVALCNDGTVWIYDLSRWIKCEDIPQGNGELVE
ncbi:hypothetical protein Mh1957_11880 [Mannheimia haemolytica]